MIHPHILLDPAFRACVKAAAANIELVAQFDRLRKTNLSLSGKPLDLAIDQASGRLDADISAFIEFVHDTVYERLDAEALAALRREVREC